MRIAIIASGSRGDVQPYIALGKGLLEAGHRVKMLTHDSYEKLISAYGLEFDVLHGNPQEVAESEELRQPAAALGKKIRAENGVANAVRVINTIEQGRATPQGSLQVH
jgi:UDP:flavonoid glycosyltransferase YjiC (YdhE family)